MRIWRVCGHVINKQVVSVSPKSYSEEGIFAVSKE